MVLQNQQTIEVLGSAKPKMILPSICTIKKAKKSDQEGKSRQALYFACTNSKPFKEKLDSLPLSIVKHHLNADLNGKQCAALIAPRIIITS